MKGIPITVENLAAHRARLEKVANPGQRKWGTMSPQAMLAHLEKAVAISLREIEAPDESNFVTRSHIMHIAAFEWLPWAKGKFKAPDYFFSQNPGSVEEERTKLLATMERFAKAVQANPRGAAYSPMFGTPTFEYWAKCQGRHFEHHYEQFGV